MKRIIFMACIMLGITVPSICQQTIFLKNGTLSPDLSDTTPSREINVTSEGIEVKYTFENGTIISDPLYPNHIIWNIKGFGINSTTAEPSVIFRNDVFEVPISGTPTIQILEAEYKDLKYKLSPARPPLSDGDYSSYNRDIVKPIANYKGFFPKSIVEAGEASLYRDMKLQPVQICPLQYNLSTETLRVYTKITYLLKYNSSPGAVRHATSRTPSDIDYMSNILVNNNSLNNVVAKTQGGKNSVKDYLIITTPDLIESAERLAYWKNLLGINVKILSKSNWTPQTIKAEIKTFYNQHPSLTYLLILGDHKHIPAEISNTGPYQHVTDYGYGCLSSTTQLSADILRGRIPVSNTKEANDIVDKIINYERNPIANASFYKTGVNCAYFQDTYPRDSCADRRFAQTAEEVRNYLISKGKDVKRIYSTNSNVFPKYWNNPDYSMGEEIPKELQKPAFLWNGTSKDIISNINSGVFYLLHRDHGSSTGWADPAFTSSDLDQLSNGYQMPVVFSINCQTGMFGGSSPCFAEKFLRKENGGCVAIYAASQTSYSGLNDLLTCGMFDAIWPEPGLIPNIPILEWTSNISRHEPIYALGAILDQGMLRLFETTSKNYSSSYYQYTRELFHCFGDPSMEIFTDTPTPYKNVTIDRSNNITVNLSGESGRITFYNSNTGDIKSYNGTTATYVTTEPKNVSVCISGHNKIPLVDYADNCILYIQNESVESSKQYSAAKIEIGSKVTDTKEEGHVTINGGEITLRANRVTLDCGTTVNNGVKLLVRKI